MGLPQTTPTASATHRIWPITTFVVLVAYLLAAYQLFVCALLAFGGFLFGFSSLGSSSGRTSSSLLENGYISAGLACLTTLPVFAALIWCGWQRGSRYGLLLIGGPAAVMAVVGFLALHTAAGTTVAPQARRLPNVADLFDDLTLVNWVVLLIFGGFAVATHLLRRLARHTQQGSAA